MPSTYRITSIKQTLWVRWRVPLLLKFKMQHWQWAERIWTVHQYKISLPSGPQGAPDAWMGTANASLCIPWSVLWISGNYDEIVLAEHCKEGAMIVTPISIYNWLVHWFLVILMFRVSMHRITDVYTNTKTNPLMVLQRWDQAPWNLGETKTSNLVFKKSPESSNFIAWNC